MALETQQVTVDESNGQKVSTDPANNAGALVLRGQALDALSHDPEDLRADLQALAGPSAGPSGGAIFNAPLPGTYNPSVFNQLIQNMYSKVNPAVSLFGYYVLNKAMSDTDGRSTFPATPYDFAGEYGPAATDIRHHILLGGTINLRWNIRLNPPIDYRSGSRLTSLPEKTFYGTTVFTARPGIAADPSRPGLIRTSYGLLNPSPISGETVLGRNVGRGPDQISVNLRVSKTWGF